MATLEIDVELAMGDFRLAIARSFELEGITALFGPSGSGKTSLLRVIAGLEASARGRVVSGNDTWQDTETGAWVPPHRREIGMVFQDARLFSHLSVAGNLRYADSRASNAQIDMEYGEVVEAMDLGPLLERKVDGLSGGERQRAAVARALITRPQLVLADEPTGNLDSGNGEHVLKLMLELNEELKTSLVIVTHDHSIAKRMDRIVVLEDGVLRDSV